MDAQKCELTMVSQPLYTPTYRELVPRLVAQLLLKNPKNAECVNHYKAYLDVFNLIDNTIRNDVLVGERSAVGVSNADQTSVHFGWDFIKYFSRPGEYRFNIIVEEYQADDCSTPLGLVAELNSLPITVYEETDTTRAASSA